MWFKSDGLDKYLKNCWNKKNLVFLSYMFMRIILYSYSKYVKKYVETFLLILKSFAFDYGVFWKA